VHVIHSARYASPTGQKKRLVTTFTPTTGQTRRLERKPNVDWDLRI